DDDRIPLIGLELQNQAAGVVGEPADHVDIDVDHPLVFGCGDTRADGVQATRIGQSGSRHDPYPSASRMKVDTKLLATLQWKGDGEVGREERGRGTFAAPEALVELFSQIAHQQRVVLNRV